MSPDQGQPLLPAPGPAQEAIQNCWWPCVLSHVWPDRAPAAEGWYEMEAYAAQLMVAGCLQISLLPSQLQHLGSCICQMASLLKRLHGLYVHPLTLWKKLTVESHLIACSGCGQSISRSVCLGCVVQCSAVDNAFVASSLISFSAVTCIVISLSESALS